METQVYSETARNEEVEVIPGDASISSAGRNTQIEVLPVDDTAYDFSRGDQRSRSSWTEDRILSLLDIYITEHQAYLKAKAERQVTEFHEYIGRLVNADGVIVAGLLKNLGREYRKAWAKCRGIEPSGGLRLRRSRELCQKFEKYYELYSRIGLRELRPMGVGPKGEGLSSPQRSHATPKIKKLKKHPPQLSESTILEHVLSPTQIKIPPMSAMSDKHWQDYIEVMREQNRALIEIGKELRLMRMGYFTEHELAMDA